MIQNHLLYFYGPTSGILRQKPPPVYWMSEKEFVLIHFMKNGNLKNRFRRLITKNPCRAKRFSGKSKARQPHEHNKVVTAERWCQITPAFWHRSFFPHGWLPAWTTPPFTHAGLGPSSPAGRGPCSAGAAVSRSLRTAEATPDPAQQPQARYLSVPSAAMAVPEAEASRRERGGAFPEGDGSTALAPPRRAAILAGSRGRAAVGGEGVAALLCPCGCRFLPPSFSPLFFPPSSRPLAAGCRQAGRPGTGGACSSTERWVGPAPLSEQGGRAGSVLPPSCPCRGCSRELPACPLAPSALVVAARLLEHGAAALPRGNRRCLPLVGSVPLCWLPDPSGAWWPERGRGAASFIGLSRWGNGFAVVASVNAAAYCLCLRYERSFR